MGNSPSFFISAKHKSTGEQVDIATVFVSKSGKGYSVVAKPGTVFKVTSQYNRESKQTEMLAKPVYVTGEEYWLNLNENIARTDKGDGVATQIRKTFDVPAGKSTSSIDDDLPF